MIKPIEHFSLTHPNSIYDEEAMTALELAGRTAMKTNECVEAINTLKLETDATFEKAVTEKVQNWMDEHPEASTTVMDKSITESKLHPSLVLATVKDYVTPQMFGAVGDGVANDTAAIQSAIDSGLPVIVPDGVYLLTAPLVINRDNVSIQSQGNNIEYRGTVRFVFSGCDGFHVNAGCRYILINGIGIEATQYLNDCVGVRFMSTADSSEIHRFRLTNCFLVNFNYGLTNALDTPCTLWNCCFKTIRTDNVPTAVLFNAQDVGNFGLVFDDFYSDNGRMKFKSTQAVFMGCNFGIKQNVFFESDNNCYFDFIGCNFEVDDKTVTGQLLKFGGKEFIFQNTNFVHWGDSATMFGTTSDTHLMRFVGCHTIRKEGNGAFWNSAILTGKNGTIEIVGSGMNQPKEFENNYYNSVVIPNASSIIKAYDMNDRPYYRQAVRFSGDRNRMEFLDDDGWKDTSGNLLTNNKQFPFAIGNGFYVDGGSLAVTGDIVTLNYNRKKNGQVFIADTPLVDGIPIMMFRDTSEAYNEKDNYAVYRVKMWDGTNKTWVNNTKSFNVSWFKISL